MTKERFVAEIQAQTDMMYRVAMSILRNEEDCRDALQDTVLRVWEKRGSLRDEDCFKAWVCRILINRCRDMLRRRRTVPLDEIPEPSVPPPDPTLAIALHSLPEALRLPLTLIYAEGMSYREAAQALRLTEVTLRGRVYRAKMQLRKELSKE